METIKRIDSDTLEVDGVKFIRALAGEPKFKVGDWVYLFGNGECVKRIKNIDNDISFPINFEGGGSWELNKHIRLATREEIESHLIKVKDEKGFKEGVKFKSLISKYNIHQCYNNFKYNASYDALITVEGEGRGNAIYYQGKWAEIIPEKKKLPKTKEEFWMFLGVYTNTIRNSSTIEEFLDDYED